MTNVPAQSALLTDLYQLTMAQGYWHAGRADHEAVFHLHFRSLPFSGGFALAAGLGPVLDFLRGFRFQADELAYLAQIPGGDGRPIFAPDFLAYLAGMKLRIDVDAIPEGTVVFPHEPLLRVRGPIIQGQLIETALLCLVNFSTLIATKAARICQATGSAPVLEFGLRRAQGADGALLASRAAYLGGCAATSNVLAGMRYGIPVRGTHAHSWVMSFADEQEAFDAYAEAMPNNVVLLVDTYDTLAGVRKAIATGQRLRARGCELAGIRLDSGDLAALSQQARALLDAAGFPQAAIVASNDLDERTIASIRAQGGTISVWGVGTKLITAYDQPALGGVYKLAAIRAPGGAWQPRIKLSEQPIKVSNPGIQNVRRFFHRDGQGFPDGQSRDGHVVADVIYDEEAAPTTWTLVDTADPTREVALAGANSGTSSDLIHRDLLIPVLRAGQDVVALPSLAASRAHAAADLARFPAALKRFDHPHRHLVGLEAGLHQRKLALIRAARGERP